VYAVNSPEAVYVLHVFQKRRKRGIAMPAHEIELMKQRLRLASDHYASLPTQEDERD